MEDLEAFLALDTKPKFGETEMVTMSKYVRRSWSRAKLSAFPLTPHSLLLSQGRLRHDEDD